MIADRIQVLVAVLWVGSLWTIGFIVAPTLFAMLPDRVLAGSIAGKLFQIGAWLSIACAMTLLGSVTLRNRGATKTVNDGVSRQAVWLITAMLACTLAGYFGLQPVMNALRDAAGPSGVMDSAARAQFGLLHGGASALYLVQSLLGGALVLKLIK